MITFILAVGAIPADFKPDSFFALYLSEGKGYKPEWLKPDGTVVPMPTTPEEAGYEPFTAGAVRGSDLLVFRGVPEKGELNPLIHSQQVGRAFEIVKRVFTADKPAKDNHLYTINFATKQVLEGCVDEGHAGQACPTCHGMGQIYGDK